MLSAEQAAKHLNSTARIIRYRGQLGLLRPGREPRRHRRFTEEDLTALRLADSIERSYDASPSELAFALRALTSPALASRIEVLAQATGRLVASSAVLNFEQQKAVALLANSARTAPQRGVARNGNR
jgi:MerR family copper efflux transcriptional regulator